jgi:hypothetical protein
LAWGPFSACCSLFASENATVHDSIAVPLFVTKLQALGSKVTSEVHAASMTSAGLDLHHCLDMRQVVVGMIMVLFCFIIVVAVARLRRLVVVGRTLG